MLVSGMAPSCSSWSGPLSIHTRGTRPGIRQEENLQHTYVCTRALGQRVLRILQNGLHSSLLWGVATMLEALGWAGVGSLMGKTLWVPLHSPPFRSQPHAFSDIQGISATTNQALSWALKGTVVTTAKMLPCLHGAYSLWGLRGG